MTFHGDCHGYIPAHIVLFVTNYISQTEPDDFSGRSRISQEEVRQPLSGTSQFSPKMHENDENRNFCRVGGGGQCPTTVVDLRGGGLPAYTPLQTKISLNSWVFQKNIKCIKLSPLFERLAPPPTTGPGSAPVLDLRLGLLVLWNEKTRFQRNFSSLYVFQVNEHV